MGKIVQLKSKARKLKEQIYVLYLAYQDQRLPGMAKVFIGLVLGYAFSPIDLIPDFVPILGYLDDLILIPLGIHLAIKMIPAEVLQDARQRAEEIRTGEKPKNWVAGVLILLIWLFIIMYIIIKL